MRVLLIGGNGFIGSHVADQLVARNFSVRVFDRRPEIFRKPLPSVDYVMGDFSDGAQLCEAMSGVDAVVHLVSTTIPATSNLDPVADITGNLIATVRLLEIMRSAKIKKFVYLSSGGTVYGVPTTHPVAETHPLRPISSYGVVKVAVENYLHMEHQLHGLRYIALRASNPYGPRQGHIGAQGIIGTHLWRAASREPLEIWGDGSVVRDYIYVDDLARLCLQALDSEAVGCFNAGSGEGTSVNEIVSCIDRAIQATGHAPITPIYKPGRSFDVPRVVLEIAKARSELNWSPATRIEAGIEKSWAWVQSRFDKDER